ncbi:hypothetical protein FH609_018260 [Streptomyces sp. 3MP-14]|uniref:FtsX-like permease family protein n=1 Tax=Streptomyces mimosae TaxID=2586635 RepID=A0A5N6A796_9ACTN|nr:MULTISPECIES: hypothetical protein [Streptomyces]KAB8164654.1 hypothetical protein FH607_015585 [Streptomyces mimosae]KAB8175570.1 hypothetical protein FH609_018260 [Streptomyces sp. 3MP-14]
MRPWRTTTRLALRLAYARHPHQRLRVVLLGTVAAVTAVTALFTAGVLHTLAEERQRFDDRTVRYAEPASGSALRVDRRDDTWGLTQFPVVWLDPADAESPEALPPGMAGWPEPGGWVISPGLARQAADHPELAQRFPDAEVLTDEGVLHPEELLAYRRVPADGALGPVAVDATGFGGPGPTIGDDAELDIPAMSLALAGLVGLPALLLAAAGTAVSAPLRANRLALLRALGVPARRRRALVVLEAGAVAGPGLALGALAWQVTAPRLDRVPLVDRPVVPGALAPPWWSAVPVLLLLAAAFALLAVVTESRRREDHHAALPRPRARRPRMSALRIAPALAAVALLAAAALRDGRLAATSTLAGVLLLAAGVPLTLPLLARRVGDRLAGRTDRPGRVLAGRRLQYDPRSAVRPLYGIAALLVIAPVVAAWIGTARDIDPPPRPDPAIQAFEVRGALGHADPDALLRELPGALAAPVTVQPGPGSSAVVRLAAGCRELASLLRESACTEDGTLAGPAERRVGLLAAGTAEVSVVREEPQVNAQLSEESTLLVLTPRTADAENALRAAALAQPAALSVLSEADDQLQESELVPWVLGGIALFSALVFLLLATGLIDRTAVGRRGTWLLIAIGLTRRRIRVINRQEFLVGYGVVGGTALVAGVVACLAWTGLDSAVDYPLAAHAAIAASAAGLALAGLLDTRLTTEPEHFSGPG